MAERAGRRPMGALAWLASVPAGLAVAGAVLTTDASATAKTVVVLAGLAVAVAGVDRTGKRFFGPDFETGFWLAVAWLVVLVTAAVLADVLPLAEARNQANALDQVPRLRPDLLSRHPLGTDKLAFDMLGEVLYGARLSLQVALLAVAVGTVAGGTVGLFAGYFRGWFDRLVGVATDSFLAFPPLILLLVVVTMVPANVVNISLALAALTFPVYIRLSRANTLAFAQREFVQAARVLGAGHVRIVFRELLPSVARPVVSYSLIIIPILIVAEASLSFLGVGIQRPTPTWGNMISAGQSELRAHPHLVFVPGGVMFLTVLAFNRIGDRVRAATDPRRGVLAGTQPASNSPK